jgi:hypothetical protein
MLCGMIRPQIDSSGYSGEVPQIQFFEESPALIAENVAAAQEAVLAGQLPPEPQVVGSIALSSVERFSLERELWVTELSPVTPQDRLLQLATAPGRFALEWIIREDLQRGNLEPMRIDMQTFAGYYDGKSRGHPLHSDKPLVSYMLLHRLPANGPPNPVLRYNANGITATEGKGPIIIHRATLSPQAPDRTAPGVIH